MLQTAIIENARRERERLLPEIDSIWQARGYLIDDIMCSHLYDDEIADWSMVSELENLAELLQWRADRLYNIVNDPNVAWRAECEAQAEDHADLLDTQECARV